MHFKIISDLHSDINRVAYNLMQFDPEAFYLIAGDVSGDRLTTEGFLIDKKIKGAFVEGNHFGYNTVTLNEDDTKQKSVDYLKSIFKKDSKLTFLNNDYIEIDDCIIVGGTLYTDFKLFNNQPIAEQVALMKMNDFRYVQVIDEDGHIRKVNPYDYETWFAETIDFIDSVCKQFPDKKIVVLTHHLPTLQLISEEYVNDSLTPAYASNLEQFILDRPNIKAWVCGHSHRCKEVFIGDCHLVCYPYGYGNENGLNLDHYLGYDIDV